MSEIWKDIEGYDGKYQVSNMGRVRSVDHYGPHGGFIKNQKLYKGQIIKPQTTRNGYMRAHIKKYKDISIHREVAKAFVPGYFEGAEVNHKDENKQNNRWDNLEWVTRKENLNYGTCIDRISVSNGCKVEQYTTDGKFIAEYPSQKAAAKAVGVCLSRIHYILNTHHTAKGYLFKRKTN